MNQENPVSPEISTLGEETRRVEENVRKINSLVHWLLIVGLTLAAAFMILGVVMSLVTSQPLSTVMIPPADLLAELAVFNPAALLTTGLLLLIATPILRVFGSLVGFTLERDWRYALVTLVVMIIVLAGIYFGQA